MVYEITFRLIDCRFCKVDRRRVLTRFMERFFCGFDFIAAAAIKRLKSLRLMIEENVIKRKLLSSRSSAVTVDYFISPPFGFVF